MIAAIVPATAIGNTLPVILPEKTLSHHEQAKIAAILAGNLNSFAFDFVARQKVQGQHLNWYIVEQLPVLPRSSYAREFGQSKASEIVGNHVLRLSFTAHDLKGFARDMGHVNSKTGDVLSPFKWDDEERCHLRARLDALFFLLYGFVNRDNVRYILNTFPGVREDDERMYNGRYRTRDLILAYMNALEAGDAHTIVAV
jgi:hypothetical protein